MAVRSALINVMIRAAEKAGRSLIRDFNEVENLQVSIKGPGDFVSAADLRAEKTVFEILKTARPQYGFLMEESGTQPGDGLHRWIIDPLDGTTNFLHGIPMFAVSIALETEGELVAGVVFNPVANELFWAEKGAGAYLAEQRYDRRLRVSARTRLEESLFATGIPHHGRGTPEEHEAFLNEARKVMGASTGIRRMGAAALDLAWVAAGRFDGYWESGISPWDMAAGIVLVREAGGYVSDLDGGTAMLKKGDVLAAPERLHGPLQALLSAVRSG